jgi:ribosome-associated protein
MQSEQIKNVAIATLEDMKAIDIQVMDVRELTDITDYMVVSSGSSDRHVKAIADKVLDALRERNVRPLGVEGREKSTWILLDFGDVVVHVMHPEDRSFYDLEGLWGDHVRQMVLAQREQHNE